MRPDGPRDDIVGPESGPAPPFPLKFHGPVVKGFGRGSKELGIPTANIPIDGLSIAGHTDLKSGIYYGWASLRLPRDHHHHESKKDKAKRGVTKVANAVSTAAFGPSVKEYEDDKHNALVDKDHAIFPMVMSIGWNPYYKNSARSVEVHLLHEFGEDFYGCPMNLDVLGFIREEYDYVDKESLIKDIKIDIEVTRRCLKRKAYAVFREDAYLLDFTWFEREKQQAAS